MNLVILSGNLTKDIETRVASSGIYISNGTIAVNRKFSKAKEVDFIDFTVFGNSAEYASKYGRKGCRVELQGRWTNQSYETRDGSKKTKSFVVVEDINIQNNEQKEEIREKDVSPEVIAVAKEINNKNLDSIDVTDDDLPF